MFPSVGSMTDVDIPLKTNYLAQGRWPKKSATLLLKNTESNTDLKGLNAHSFVIKHTGGSDHSGL